MQPKNFFRRKQSKKLRLSLYSWTPDPGSRSAFASMRTRIVRPTRMQEAY